MHLAAAFLTERKADITAVGARVMHYRLLHDVLSYHTLIVISKNLA
jgi:hypothetical protein